MATGVILDPLAQSRVQAVLLALEREFGVESNQKQIVNALVYGATPGQLVGMIFEFKRAQAVRDQADTQGTAESDA